MVNDEDLRWTRKILKFLVWPQEFESKKMDTSTRIILWASCDWSKTWIMLTYMPNKDCFCFDIVKTRKMYRLSRAGIILQLLYVSSSMWQSAELRTWHGMSRMCLYLIICAGFQIAKGTNTRMNACFTTLGTSIIITT